MYFVFYNMLYIVTTNYIIGQYLSDPQINMDLKREASIEAHAQVLSADESSNVPDEETTPKLEKKASMGNLISHLKHKFTSSSTRRKGMVDS